jgi:predicted membrane protein
MDWQWIANSLFAILGFLLSILISSTRSSIKELHTSDSILADKVQRIEVLVAGDYVKKEEMNTLIQALFNKLDKIENKIDNKVDK